jgi:2-C-methyl-D-erythritol 4-phosphate cytidylyltransferase
MSSLSRMRYLILVAGGTGTRMNRPVAKQFLPLGGRPVIVHTLTRFREAYPDLYIVLVLHESLHPAWEEVVTAHPEARVDRVVNGGAERFHSVREGMAALPEGTGWVGIHDAVRPFAEVDTIRRCYEAAEKSGAAIPVVPVKDTIRQVGEQGSAPLNRAALRAVQTPQVFSLPRLRVAYEVGYQPHFTDDASVWEFGGTDVTLVDGDLHNIKITTPEDLLSAEAFLSLRDAPNQA